MVLFNKGFQKGDRVALYMPMIPEVAVAILAICKIGVIITPVFPDMQRMQLPNA